MGSSKRVEIEQPGEHEVFAQAADGSGSLRRVVLVSTGQQKAVHLEFSKLRRLRQLEGETASIYDQLQRLQKDVRGPQLQAGLSDFLAGLSGPGTASEIHKVNSTLHKKIVEWYQRDAQRLNQELLNRKTEIERLRAQLSQ